MFDSLPYRNDAALVFRRLIRSLPRRSGVIGIATCDKGLPAMMMALAAMHDLPCIMVPGGVTLPPSDGEDAGAVQTIGARYSRGLISLQEAATLGCRACGSPGGGCQFLGTAATSQVVAEALGHGAPPLCSRALRPAGLAGHRRPLGARHHRARKARNQDAGYPHARCHSECHDGPRRLRRFHESPAAYSGHRPLRRASEADRRGLDRGQPAHAAARGCASQWPTVSSHDPRIPGRRRARGHAPPSRAWPPRSGCPHRHAARRFAQIWRSGRASSRQAALSRDC